MPLSGMSEYAGSNEVFYPDEEIINLAEQGKSNKVFAASIPRVRSSVDLNPTGRSWLQEENKPELTRPKSESDYLYRLENSVLERYLSSLQMPTRRLATFKGDKMAYNSFIRGFENIVASKLNTDGEKLDFLLQYVKGEAKEIIESTDDLPEDKGYREARRLLERTYGQTCRSANYEQKLLSWPEIHYNDADGLVHFASFL